MKRILLVKNSIVQNVVGYEDNADVPAQIDGCDTVFDPTEIVNVGDAYDQRDIQLDRTDQLIFKELFRLTNAERAGRLVPLPALTPLEYRAFLKTRM